MSGNNDAPSLAPVLIGCGSGFLSLAFVFVGIRIWSKVSIVGRLLVEDYLCILAWLLSAASTISAAWCTKFGIGRHIEDVPLRWIFEAKYPQAIFVMTLTAMASLTVIQMSILFFYLRIMPSRTFSRLVYATMVYVVASGVGVFLALVFGCKPIEASWSFDRFVFADCLDYFMIYRWGAILNAIADTIVFALPLPFIYRSQLPRLQKLHVLFVFCLGGLVVISGFVLIALVVKTGISSDFTWDGAIPMIGASIEINLAVICACLPALKHLLSFLSPRYFSYNYQVSGQHPRLGPVNVSYSMGGSSSNQRQSKWVDIEKEATQQEGFSLGYIGDRSSQAALGNEMAESVRTAESIRTVVGDSDGLDNRPVPLEGTNDYSSK